MAALFSFKHRVDSKCLKSERSDFGIFEKCSIPKWFGFRTVSEIRTISFGFQTFGSFLVLSYTVLYIRKGGHKKLFLYKTV